MSSASENRKYPSKRMNGLRLTARVMIQVVVARMKAAERTGPSGMKLQASVIQAAIASSVAIPA